MFVGMAAILSVVMASLLIKDEGLMSALQNVAILNITISIGLGAISISLNKDDKTLNFLKQILLIMLLSILSYHLPYWDNSIISRVYFFIMGFSTISILLSVVWSIEELKKKNKPRSVNYKRGNRKKSKK